MRISDARDPEAIQGGFARWLRVRFPEAADVSVAPIARPDAGLSAETLFIEVDLRAPDGETYEHLSLVVRLPPTGEALFPVYDLAGQGAVQQRLAGAGIPTVAPLAVEEDRSWVGAPFLVMARVAGRTVRNDAPFLRRGWLAEATHEDQARLHAGVLDVLARLHRLQWDDIDWGDAAIAFLRAGATADGPKLALPPAPVLDATLGRWSDYLAWTGGEVPPPLERALSWCRSHLPRVEPPASVLWGDVQLGNVVVADDMTVAAILDFELASLGPAEMDVAWFLVLHSMTVASCGGDLPGFPGRDQTLARYEALLGRALHDLRWYEVFAALRAGSIMARAARLLSASGIDDTWLTNGNPVMDLITDLMDT